uniref:Uncharacterized protein n=1 Tax=Arundo donax TaxID=35708 RepID=A0A0A9BC00_ARUDO
MGFISSLSQLVWD